MPTNNLTTSRASHVSTEPALDLPTEVAALTIHASVRKLRPARGAGVEDWHPELLAERLRDVRVLEGRMRDLDDFLDPGHRTHLLRVSPRHGDRTPAVAPLFHEPFDDRFLRLSGGQAGTNAVHQL